MENESLYIMGLTMINLDFVSRGKLIHRQLFQLMLFDFQASSLLHKTER